MGMDFNLVSTEIRKANVAATVLGTEETLTKWKAIAEKFGRSKSYSFQFWDELNDPSILFIESGWGFIKKMISPLENLYLFFELEDEKTAFLFEHGKELADVLIEVGCRDFYLLDEDMNFLICYSDHDVIFAEGAAKSWLNVGRN